MVIALMGEKLQIESCLDLHFGIFEIQLFSI